MAQVSIVKESKPKGLGISLDESPEPPATRAVAFLKTFLRNLLRLTLRPAFPGSRAAA